MKVQSTLSKALLMSIFKVTSPIFPLFLHLMWWIISKIKGTLSRIGRSSTKADCSCEIHLWRIGLRQLAWTLEMILQMILHKEIGLKSLMMVEFFYFGNENNGSFVYLRWEISRFKPRDTRMEQFWSTKVPIFYYLKSWI